MSFYLDYLYVKESDLHGKGVFTKIAIPKDATIMKIIGELINETECIRRENEENNVYIFYKDVNQYIDTKYSDIIKFINHKCNCNCYVDEDKDGNLILIALKDINAGEELTIDYSYDEIYDSCNCKSCDE